MYLYPLGKSTLSKSTIYKGAKVVYSQLGSGETVVLLHGFLEERSMWSQFANSLSNDFNILTIDLLGQGETDSLGYVHSISAQAKAVKAVLQKEGIESCLIVGHSMGGYIALELAHQQPEMVMGLILFHSTAYSDSEDRKRDRERVIRLVQRSKDVYIRAVVPSLFSDDTRDELSTEIQDLVETANGFTEQGIIANIRGMMDREPRENVLKNAAFNKLIIHGEFDSVISTEHIMAQAELNNNIELATVDGIGHMGHLEAPETCLHLISEFCKRTWKN